MNIIFQNPGLIDLVCIRTFGINVKVNSNPIGFFGTGLKYAIAVILREKGVITIYRGKEEYRFTTKATETRGKSFDVVHMNDKPLGFTTELGKTWEMWQAFRELYCNATDENGTIWPALSVEGIVQEDKTTVVVFHEEMAKAYDDRADTILMSAPIFTSAEVNIHPGGGHYLYYRGIRVAKMSEHFRYTYNFQKKCELTEDRTLKYPSYDLGSIPRSIAQSTEQIFLREVLTTPKDMYEHDMSYTMTSPSTVFMEVTKQLRLEKNIHLNHSALSLHNSAARASMMPKDSIMDDDERKMLSKSIAFCQKLGFDMTLYPIIVTDTLGPNVLGQAANGKLYLSKLPFMQGVERVAGTLMEEYIHLSQGFADETRDMQNYLIDLIIKVAKNGNPL